MKVDVTISIGSGEAILREELIRALQVRLAKCPYSHELDSLLGYQTTREWLDAILSWIAKLTVEVKP